MLVRETDGLFLKVSSKKPSHSDLIGRNRHILKGLTNYSLEKTLKQSNLPPGIGPMVANSIDGRAGQEQTP